MLLGVQGPIYNQYNIATLTHLEEIKILINI